jgi:hypothetical protein
MKQLMCGFDKQCANRYYTGGSTQLNPPTLHWPKFIKFVKCRFIVIPYRQRRLLVSNQINETPKKKQHQSPSFSLMNLTVERKKNEDITSDSVKDN